MSQREIRGIDLEQLAPVLKDMRDRKKKKKKKKKKDKKKKKALKLITADQINEADQRKEDASTRYALIRKLKLKENVEGISNTREPDEYGDRYTRLKTRSEGAYGTLIYELQKDLKDLQRNLMSTNLMSSNFQTNPIFQPAQSQFSRLRQQPVQLGNDRFDAIIEAQRKEVENKKNQDRIEKEAKAEIKRLEAEAKAELKRIEKEAKAEQARARAEQARAKAEQNELVKQQIKINKEQEQKDEEVKRLLRIRADRERAKDTKVQSLISNYTISQGMRTLTDYLPPAAPVTAAQLPFGRQRPEFDPNEQTPFYRSTKDRIDTPVLRDVLEGGGTDSVFTSDEILLDQSEDFPPPVDETQEDPEDESMNLMIDEAFDEALLEGGGAGAEAAEKVAETPAKKKILVRVSGEPIVVSGKKKGGRPAGSKNKPKPPPSDPSQIARLGGSSVVGRTPKGKTPANTPSGSAN